MLIMYVCMFAYKWPLCECNTYNLCTQGRLRYYELVLNLILKNKKNSWERIQFIYLDDSFEHLILVCQPILGYREQNICNSRIFMLYIKSSRYCYQQWFGYFARNFKHLLVEWCGVGSI